MNVSEFIVDYLVKNGIDTVFGVVGGAALWLCKALGSNHDIHPIFTNHEQAAVMAAEGWARIKGKPGVVFTINGPGMTNTVTGIAQAWTDSAPIILLTGNSNLNSIEFERTRGVRQYGTQDVRTDLIMQGITKKYYLLKNSEDVYKCIDEALRLSLEGRPGPVCIELPINVQSSEVPSNLNNPLPFAKQTADNSRLYDHILDKLASAKRPLILAGQGIRLSGAVDSFREFVTKYDIPVVNSRMGIDSMVSDDIHLVGRCGNHGDRASHFAIQTCDLLLVLGSRLAPNTTGYDVSKFSPQSYKILVDIDERESEKKDIQVDEFILDNVKSFLDYSVSLGLRRNKSSHASWVDCCHNWRCDYPIISKDYYKNDSVSTYRVVDVISKKCNKDDLILSDTGSCCGIVAQTWHVKENQRLFISGGLSAMGYYITSIGLAVATNQRVICFVGDGSLQMNIQDLATIKAYNLPIKLVVISNGGYQFVRMSQGAYGIDPPFGTDIEQGLPIPDIGSIVQSYGLQYLLCDDANEIENSAETLLKSNGPAVLEVMVRQHQEVIPRLKSVAQKDGSFVSPKYENLYPFLDAQVLDNEMRKAMRK